MGDGDGGEQLEEGKWALSEEEEEDGEEQAEDLTIPQVSSSTVLATQSDQSQALVAVKRRRTAPATPALPAPVPVPVPSAFQQGDTATRSKKPEHKKRCRFCNDWSFDVPWFKEETVRIDGVLFIIALAEDCFVCGTACEAWPLLAATAEGKVTLKNKYATEKAFRTEFDAVRVGAKAMSIQILKQQSVQSSKACGLVIKVFAALVDSDVFKHWFKQPPTSVPGVTVIKAIGPDNTEICGAVLQRESLPEGIPHFVIELFSRTERVMATQLLPCDRVLRQGQADERYNLACKSWVANRKPIATDTLAAAVTADDVHALIKTHQVGVQGQVAVHVAGEAGSGEEVPAQTFNGSMLDDDDAQQQQQQQAPGSGKKKRAGTSSGNGAPPTRAVRQRTGTSSASASNTSAAATGPTSFDPEDPATGTGGGAGNTSRKRRRAPGSIDANLVLMGWQPGRELKSLEHKLSNAVFEVEEEKELVEGEVIAVNAARIMQLAKILKMPWDEISKNLSTLEIQLVDVPPIHMQVVCIRRAQLHLSEGQIAKWLAVVNALPTRWVIETPCFGACWIDWQAEKDMETIDSTQQERLRSLEKTAQSALSAYHAEEKVPQGQRWLQAVFNSGWIAFFTNVAKDTAATAKFLEINLALADYLQGMSSSSDSALRPYIATALHVARGFVGLMSPVPHHAGASLEDVDFLNKASGKPAVVDKLPKIGQLIATKMRQVGKTDGPASIYWRDALSDYRTHVGPEGVMCDDFHKLAKQAREVRSGADVAIADEMWKLAIDHLNTWQSSLRAGATNQLEDDLLAILKSDMDELQTAVKQGEQSISEAIQMAQWLKESANLLYADRARPFMKELCLLTDDWGKREDSDMIMAKIVEFKATPSPQCLNDIATKLRMMSNLPPDLQPALASAVDPVLTWFETIDHANSLCDLGDIVCLLRISKASHTQLSLDILEKAAEAQEALTVRDRAGNFNLSKIGKTYKIAEAEVAKKKPQDASGSAGLWTAMDASMRNLRGSYLEILASALEGLDNTLITTTLKLSGVAGGGKNGARWYAGHEDTDDILAVFTETLGVANTDAIEALVVRVKSLMSQQEVLLAYHRGVLGAAVGELCPNAKKCTDQAKKTLQVAAITKYEKLLCLALSRKSSKTKDRCENFTASLSLTKLRAIGVCLFLWP